MKKAKMIALFVSAVLAFSFFGCNNGSDIAETGNLGGGGNTGGGGGNYVPPNIAGEWVQFKDIAYFDESGNSVALQFSDNPSGETIGDAWGALFANGGHNQIDLQIWQTESGDATFTLESSDINEEGMLCTAAYSNWFGGAIVQNPATKPTDADCTFYDMSAVRKIVFKVRASTPIKIWAGASNKNASDGFKQQDVNVTVDWQEVTIHMVGVQKAFAIFAFAWESDDVSTPLTIGDGWGNTFANRNHNPFAVQIWTDPSGNLTFGFGASDISAAEGVQFTATAEGENAGWFGGAFVQDPARDPKKAICYDMSSVVKIRFEAQASKAINIWAGTTDNNHSSSFNKSHRFDVTTSWQSFEFSCTSIPKSFAPFGFADDAKPRDFTAGDWIRFRNIDFLDKNGHSVALKWVK